MGTIVAGNSSINSGKSIWDFDLSMITAIVSYAFVSLDDFDTCI